MTSLSKHTIISGIILCPKATYGRMNSYLLYKNTTIWSRRSITFSKTLDVLRALHYVAWQHVDVYISVMIIHSSAVSRNGPLPRILCGSRFRCRWIPWLSTGSSRRVRRRSRRSTWPRSHRPSLAASQWSCSPGTPSLVSTTRDHLMTRRTSPR